MKFGDVSSFLVPVLSGVEFVGMEVVITCQYLLPVIANPDLYSGCISDHEIMNDDLVSNLLSLLLCSWLTMVSVLDDTDRPRSKHTARRSILERRTGGYRFHGGLDHPTGTFKVAYPREVWLTVVDCGRLRNISEKLSASRRARPDPCPTREELMFSGKSATFS